MRNFYLSIFLLFSGSLAFAQTIYVDVDATGNNDGSSWTDAYTSLQDALTNAADDAEVWVAEGTYLPPADTSFIVSSAISIIGGFEGTETSSDQADLNSNPTVLSGDFNGDDDPVDLIVNREDNRRIMLIDSLEDGEVFISNFQFKGGFLPETPDGDFIDFYSGGAIFSYAPLQTENLFFSECVADFGAAIALYYDEAFGSVISNVTCTNNLTFANGMIYLRSTSGITITNSTFDQNAGSRGGGIYGQNGDGVNIENCTFTNNDVEQRAGGIGMVRFANIDISKCTFDNNRAGFGGAGFYGFYDEEFLEDPGNRVTFSDCIVTNNSSDEFGTGVYGIRLNMEIENCRIDSNSSVGMSEDNRNIGTGYYFFDGVVNIENTSLSYNNTANLGGGGSSFNTDFNFANCQVIGNTAGDRGAGLYFNSGDDDPAVSIQITDSDILDNSITGPGRGAGLYFTTNNLSDIDLLRCEISGNECFSLGSGIYMQNTNDLSMVSCDFRENGGQTTSTDGNALCALGDFDTLGISQIITIDDCSFFNNTGNDDGGALYVQSTYSNSEVSITNSEFISNIAADNGGAIYVLPGADIDIDNCEFAFNSGEDGGSIWYFQGIPNPDIDSLEAGRLDISNTIFNSNLATTQGGAINFAGGLSGDLNNNIFIGNAVSNTGAGGAFIANGDSAVVTQINVYNNTFYENSSVTLGDDIAAFLDPLDDGNATLNISLLNSAFISSNGLGNIAIEDGNPNFESLGGNYFNQASTFTVAEDIVDENVNPIDLFISDGFDPINLKPRIGSPLVNAGESNANVPATDIEGLSRNGVPEIGAHEISFSTVADIIMQSPIHTQLEQLLDTANLITTLQGNGPFTVFAPTDAAFDAIEQANGDITTLLADIDNRLTPYLVGHVVDDIIYTWPIINDEIDQSTSLAGSTLLYSEENFTTALVNEVPIAPGDILAENGVVHVVDSTILLVMVSTEDIADSGLDVDIYPNPVAGQLNLDILEPGLDQVNVQLFDLQGRELLKFELGNGNHDLDMSSLVSGTYLMRLQIEGKAYRQWIMKQ
ncbi:MAG: fasciclin domain-containing protein [Bacteroidota bacterium]